MLLTVRPAHGRRPPQQPVAYPWLFAAWMAAAALVAVVAGLVLGVMAAAEAGIGADRWTQAVQAHGRLQLLGFVAPFVMALAFEFIPRLLGRPPFGRALRASVPATFLAGAAALAAGQVWHNEAGWLTWPGALLTVAGSVAFATIVWRVRLPRPLRIDAQPFYLRAASVWLVVASVAAAIASSRAEAGVVPLTDSRAVVELFLRGFVTLMIMGIALRAFVGHLGLQPLPPPRQLAVLAVLNLGLLAWLAGLGFAALPDFTPLLRVGDAAHGLALLLFAGWFGIWRGLFRPARSPRYRLLLPASWTGAYVYAGWLLVSAVVAPATGLSLYEEGAIRHTFLLGFMVPLMVAMAHVVLARFATGTVPWEPALTAAFWLAFIAWPLRVIPAAASEAPSGAGTIAMVTAGALLMAALTLLAAVSSRTAVLVRRSNRAMARAAAAPMPSG